LVDSHRLSGESHKSEAAKSQMSDKWRPRLEEADTVGTGICPYCAVGCSQLIYAKNNKVIHIEGDPRSPINQGTLCPKGAATYDWLTSELRINEVLYRAPHFDRWEKRPLDWAMDYGLSPVKPSKYDTLVWGYTYIAGLAGSAQIISTLASLLRNPEWQAVVRNGRYIATAGSALGGVLLIADLHTPRRWYNMLRIYRPTSPMSLGTYVLSGFGISSGLAAADSLLGNIRGLRWLQPAARVSQIPAAVTGAGMSTYTGALLAATSTPLWAAAPRLMAARFACSAMALPPWRFPYPNKQDGVLIPQPRWTDWRWSPPWQIPYWRWPPTVSTGPHRPATCCTAGTHWRSLTKPKKVWNMRFHWLAMDGT
jgi:hypothetical protein